MIVSILTPGPARSGPTDAYLNSLGTSRAPPPLPRISRPPRIVIRTTKENLLAAKYTRRRRRLGRENFYEKT